MSQSASSPKLELDPELKKKLEELAKRVSEIKKLIEDLEKSLPKQK